MGAFRTLFARLHLGAGRCRLDAHHGSTPSLRCRPQILNVHLYILKRVTLARCTSVAACVRDSPERGRVLRLDQLRDAASLARPVHPSPLRLPLHGDAPCERYWHLNKNVATRRELLDAFSAAVAQNVCTTQMVAGVPCVSRRDILLREFPYVTGTGCSVQDRGYWFRVRL